MTRKDFEAIARAIEANQVYGQPADDWTRGLRAGLRYVARDLAELFAADNPNFDRARFLKACGIEEQ